MATKQVFTADVVTYDFLPEKYAKEQDLITAELNINVKCDWQEAINLWYSGANHGLGDDLGSIDTGLQMNLTNAQRVYFNNTTKLTSDGSAVDGATAMVGSDIVTLEHAQKAVQQCLYHICAEANYWTGSGTGSGVSPTTVATQFKTVLSALLGASSYSGEDTNPLAIDIEKVKSDLHISGTAPLNTISVTNQPTSKLKSLINGYAFVPVLNRLVAGGNFNQGVIDGGEDTGDFKFDSALTYDSDGNKIKTDAQLVFPIRILVADDGVTALQTSSADPAGSVGLAFQLNIIFSSDTDLPVVDSGIRV